MDRRVRVLAAVVVAMLWAGIAVAQPPASGPSMTPLWTVHIDEVRPDKAAEFERLNIAENQGLHAILRKYDQPIKPVYEIATARGVYMSLRPKLSFTDFDAPSTIPDSVSKLFSTVTDSLNAALKRSKYPWCVSMFSSSYGDGAYKYLWQADSRAAFLESGDRAAVLTAVFGKQTARQMLADWRRCLAGSETVDATARRDYTDLAESVPWLGLPPR